MKTTNIFEVADRLKLRFEFRGSISTEELWDLSVENLDTIFKQLNAKIKKANEESLLNKKTAEDEIINTKIEIVKHIVTVKLAEADERAKVKEVKEKKQKIMAALNDLEDAEFKNKSGDELRAMLKELNNQTE